MKKKVTSESLFHQGNIIKNNPKFKAAIREHYQINYGIYRERPLFYKVILQESRFNIVFSMCCFVFGNEASCVSDIKEICYRHQIASPNSVIAIISLLKATSRIDTWRSKKDRRKVLIAPTQKGINELKRYIFCAFSPLNILYPEYNISVDLMDDKVTRYDFFRRASQYLFCGLIFKKILPEVGVFIEKDGGRMIMLSLYLQAIEKMTSRGAVISYSSNVLAKEFFVSRVHVNKIIKTAQDMGYMREKADGLIEIYPSFIHLVENYAGLYFSSVMHYLNLHPEK